MGKANSAVVGLIQCQACQGYIALGRCHCIKNKDKHNEKNPHLVSALVGRSPLKQNIKGADYASL